MSRRRTIRALLHAHSDWSYDGSWTLEQLGRLFTRWGFDVALMSEHDTGFDPESFGAYRAACAAASPPGGCLLVPGIEYSSPDNDIHILTWGLNRFLAEHRPVDETLSRVEEAGGVAVFAHPARRDAWAKYDPAWTPRLCAVEIWNRKTDGLKPGAEAIHLWRKTGLAATVGVDFHRLKHLYPLDNLIDVDVTAQDQDIDCAYETLRALRERRTRPRAVGLRLLDEAGGLRAVPGRLNAGLEAARRRARDAVRRIRPKRRS